MFEQENGFENAYLVGSTYIQFNNLSISVLASTV